LLARVSFHGRATAGVASPLRWWLTANAGVKASAAN
jgi:hypothetical protein